MLFPTYALSLFAVSLCLEPRFSERFVVDGGEYRYSLNFSWPIADVLELPSEGVTWDVNSTKLPPNPDGARWVFTLTSPRRHREPEDKVYLSLRLRQLPSNFSYLLASAKCGIIDVDGHLKNVEKTGKNVLQKPLSLRFNPFLRRNLLVQDSSLLRTTNGTMVVDCAIDGVWRENLASRRVRDDGRVVASSYPSRLDAVGTSGGVQVDGTFKFNLTFDMDEFEEWPMVYSTGNTCFNNSPNVFHYQFRTHNPSNNHYPLMMWLGFVPYELNSFSSTCTCGLMNSNGHKMFAQTVSARASGSLLFFDFPRFLNCDSFEDRKPVLLADGLLRVNCVFEGTFLSLAQDVLDGLVDRNLQGCSN